MSKFLVRYSESSGHVEYRLVEEDSLSELLDHFTIITVHEEVESDGFHAYTISNYGYAELEVVELDKVPNSFHLRDLLTGPQLTEEAARQIVSDDERLH